MSNLTRRAVTVGVAALLFFAPIVTDRDAFMKYFPALSEVREIT